VRTRRKIALGLVVTLLFFAVAELLARAFLGPPHPPMVASIPSDGTFLQLHGDMVHAPYQEPELPPFPLEPGERPRVVWLGGSSVHGAWGVDTNREAAAQVMGVLPIESLNLGSPGLDTTHLVQLLPEALALQPAAIVLYTGHNDFGNHVFTGAFDERTQVGIALASWARNSRLYELLAVYLGRQNAIRPAEAASEFYELGPKEKAFVRGNLEQRLRWLARAAQEAEVPLILLTPVSNPWSPSLLWECPEKAAAIDLGETARPNDPRRIPREQLEGDCRDLVWARAVSDRDHETLDWLRDTDPLPTRADGATVEMIRRVAEEEGLLLVDINASFRERGGGLEPEAWFIDNLHPSPRGQRAISRHVAPTLETLLWP